MNWLIALAVIFLGFLNLNLKENISGEIPGYNTITENDLMTIVEYLSSPKCAGRLSGHRGYDTAAQFVSEKFRNLNLKPLHNESYFQVFNVEYNEIQDPVHLKLLNYIPPENNFKGHEYELGKDYVCRGMSGSGKVDAQAVFCGYGLSQPSDGYDDYYGVDVNGKIVIVFKSNPLWKLNDTTEWHDVYPRDKARTAVKHGALALIIVSPPNHPNPQKAIISVLEGKGEQEKFCPQLHAEIEVVNQWLKESGYNLSQLQSFIDSTKKPFSLPLKVMLNVEVNAHYIKEQSTKNIIGFIEGSDSLLNKEYVVIGAHLDHVGSQGGKIYAPGANDNASGSASVLEIAEAFAKMEVRPRRSLIFVLFASEELGLYGSSYFINNSPVPLDNITAMINLDCVGFGDSIQIGNGLSSPELWKVAREQDNLHTQQMVNSTWGGGGADAGPFHSKGIPAIYFVTTNSYRHLHLTTDTPETLNRPLFEKITKLAYLTAYQVANGNYIREKVKE